MSCVVLCCMFGYCCICVDVCFMLCVDCCVVVELAVIANWFGCGCDWLL